MIEEDLEGSATSALVLTVFLTSTTAVSEEENEVISSVLLVFVAGVVGVLGGVEGEDAVLWVIFGEEDFGFGGLLWATVVGFVVLLWVVFGKGFMGFVGLDFLLGGPLSLSSKRYFAIRFCFRSSVIGGGSSSTSLTSMVLPEPEPAGKMRVFVGFGGSRPLRNRR